jgi:mono/diheme cytochrome c family protein
MKKLKFLLIPTVGVLLLFNSCQKADVTPTADNAYVPTLADVTAAATLAELQQGRTFYVNSCGACHGLYSPDSFSASGWSGVLSNMIPRTGLSSANAALLRKYVTRGK